MHGRRGAEGEPQASLSLWKAGKNRPHVSVHAACLLLGLSRAVPPLSRRLRSSVIARTEFSSRLPACAAPGPGGRSRRSWGLLVPAPPGGDCACSENNNSVPLFTAWRPHKAMEDSARIFVPSRDCAVLINALGTHGTRARHIEGGDRAVLVPYVSPSCSCRTRIRKRQ
jgi:hypothetical protein